MLQQKESKALVILRYTLIALILVAILFPIVWLILTSFKPAEDIMVSPPHFLFKPTLDNYIYALQKANFLMFIKNTLLVAIISTVFVIVLSTLAAYSFARYNPGGGNVLFFILTTKMFPAIAVVLPYFLIFKEIGNTGIGNFLQIGLDKPGALIVSYTMFNLPFAIWLMVSFFQDIPRELEELSPPGWLQPPASASEGGITAGDARYRRHCHLLLDFCMERVPICIYPHPGCRPHHHRGS